jgi:hypothetical protein
MVSCFHEEATRIEVASFCLSKAKAKKAFKAKKVVLKTCLQISRQTNFPPCLMV